MKILQQGAHQVPAAETDTEAIHRGGEQWCDLSFLCLRMLCRTRRAVLPPFVGRSEGDKIFYYYQHELRTEHWSSKCGNVFWMLLGRTLARCGHSGGASSSSLSLAGVLRFETIHGIFVTILDKNNYLKDLILDYTKILELDNQFQSLIELIILQQLKNFYSPRQPAEPQSPCTTMKAVLAVVAVLAVAAHAATIFSEEFDGA